MAKFRSINIHVLKENVYPEKFENFVLGEFQNAYKEVSGFIALELQKKVEDHNFSVKIGEEFSEIKQADYIISEFWDTKESHDAIWRSGLSGEEIMEKIGPRATQALLKLYSDFAEKVGLGYYTVIE